MNVQIDHINVQLMLHVPIQLAHTSVLAILDLLVMEGMELTVALILMNVKIVISYVLNILCVLTQLGVTNACAQKNSSKGETSVRKLNVLQVNTHQMVSPAMTVL